MLALLVQHGLILDSAALVPRLHRTEHPAALADAVELREDRGLDEIS